VLDQLTAMVHEAAFSSLSPEVESLEGFHNFHRGHLLSAQEHLERALTGFAARPAEQRVSQMWPLPHDAVAGAAIVLAGVSAVRGELDEAEHWEREAFRRSEEIDSPRGPLSLALVDIYAAWIRRFLGDVEAAQRLGAASVSIGQEHGFALWSTLGTVLAATDTPGDAPDRKFLERSVVAMQLMGHQAFVGSHLTFLARLDAAAGEVDRARAHLAEALDAVHQMGEDLHLPELLRQRAAVTLTHGGDTAQAVADLTEAVRIATRQGARVSRLRAALDLARLPAGSRPEHWRILLAEARGDVPPSFVTDETAGADLLLDR
jgi:tetratricopeptide (TPR) repeat protein